MTFIKALLILAALFLLASPFLPLSTVFQFRHYNHEKKNRPRNLFLLLALLLFSVAVFIFIPKLLNLLAGLLAIPFVKAIVSKIPVYATYCTKLFAVLLINILFCRAALLLLAIVRKVTTVKELKNRVKNRKGIRGFFRGLWEKIKDFFRKDRESGETKEEPKLSPLYPDGLPEELTLPPEEDRNNRKIVLEASMPDRKPGKKKATTDRSGQPAAKEKKGSLLDRFFRLFYFKDGEGNWIVKAQFHKAAEQLRFFLILAGAFFLLTFFVLLVNAFYKVDFLPETVYRFLNSFVDWAYLYPSFGMLFLLELYFFLDGDVREVKVDYVEDFYPERRRGVIVDLEKLEKKLFESYGKDHEIQIITGENMENETGGHYVLDFETYPILKNILAYVDRLELSRNNDYLFAVQSMEKGKDVLIDAPLYSALGPYLYMYFSLLLSSGKHIVVISRDKSEEDALVETIRNGLKEVSRTEYPVWEVCGTAEIRNNVAADVLVLSPKDFLDEKLFGVCERFFQSVTVAFLPDADKVVTFDNYLCRILAEKIRHYAVNPVQFLFLETRHSLGLANSIKELFRLSGDLQTVDSDYSFSDFRLYLWKTKKSGVTVLDNNAQTVLLEANIAKTARGMGISQLQIVSQGAIFANQVDSDWLKLYDPSRRPIGFAIVADDEFNLPGTIYAYSRYIGKKVSLLHIVSKPYLLRDYFYENAGRYLFEQPLLERNVAEQTGCAQSEWILLVCRLTQGLDLLSFTEKYGTLAGKPTDGPLDRNAVQKMLNDCVRNATGEDLSGNVRFYMESRVGEDYSSVPVVRLVEQDSLTGLLESTDLVRVVFTGGREPVSLHLFKKMLVQRYLEGQNLIYNHKNYLITAIDTENGIIYADDALSVHNVPQEYVQIREYTMDEHDTFAEKCRAYPSKGQAAFGEHTKDTRILFKSGADGQTVLKSLAMVSTDDEIRLVSDTKSYYKIGTELSEIDLRNRPLEEVELSPATREKLKRSIHRSLYLRLEGTFEQDDRRTMTLAVLLQEMMKTLFPEQYFCVSVCPILKNPRTIYENPDPLCRQIAGLYPRLTGWNRVSENAVELLLIDDCEKGGCGVLDTLFEKECIFMENIFGMLSEYLRWQLDRDCGSYIFYGLEQAPAIYDLFGVRKILETFKLPYVRSHDLSSDSFAGQTCLFCHGKIGEDDGYLRGQSGRYCAVCAEEYVPGPEEVQKLAEYESAYLADQFGVSPGLYTVLQKEAGWFTDGRLSDLNFESRELYLADDLPLTAAHAETLRQLVRLWQYENLRLTGEDILDGQPEYVLLQYMTFLRQFAFCANLSNVLMRGTEKNGRGYRELYQEMIAAQQTDSFAYLLCRAAKPSEKQKTRKPIGRTVRAAGQEAEYYYESLLSGGEKTAYGRIFEAIDRMAPEVSLTGLGLSADTVRALVGKVFCDHTEIFWMRAGQYRYSSDGVWFDYAMTPEERAERQREIDREVEPLLAALPENGSDYDVALYFYKKLVAVMDYDSLELERQKKIITSSDGPDDLRNIYGALVRHKSVCAGYAVAYAYLLHKAGILAFYQRGDCLDGERHAWNIVEIDGKFYHVDVCWGDSSNTDTKKNQSGISYGYFCVTDEDIERSRTIDKTFGVPACVSRDANYFVVNGLWFEEYDPALLHDRITEALNGEETHAAVQLRFRTKALAELAQEQLIHQGGFRKILCELGFETTTVFGSLNPTLNVMTLWDESWGRTDF